MTRLFVSNHAPVSRIVAEFLASNSQPSTNDWSELIRQHPEYAGELADIAMLRAGAQAMEEPTPEMPLNQVAFDATVSQAINLVYQTPSAPLSDLEQRVESVRGPAVRQLAQDVGLGPHVALVSGVLAGSIAAPRKLLERLAQRLDASALALAEVLRRSFMASAVPAHKAQAGKPEVSLTPTPWEDAVRAMNLSSDDTEQLLELMR